MDSISHRYYKHSKTFLSIISLWPCDKRWSKRILRIFICLLLASGTVVQLTTCVTSTCTGDVLLKLLPYVIVTIIFFLKYVTICFKIETLQQALLVMNDMPELLNAASHLSANLIYLFFTNFLGQSIMDHSSSIFTDAYCAPWYAISSPAQHMLLIAMQRSMEGWAISVAGVFVPCFEGFSMIMRMAMSYFMALRSLQR
ncbi:hypothetical protein KM043_002519 [Ampulex compressa]|nr:hypothetical protein KM043_002519 [Ampulex compressa]